MSKEEKKVNRRDFLFTASYTIGAVGLGAVVWHLVHQMNPDKAQQALATTEVDVSQVEPGNSITVLWRGKPVFLKRRTQEEIAEARAVSLSDLPDPQKDEERVKDGKLIDIDSVTDAYMYLYNQNKNAWTFELDIRTSKENW